MKKLLLAFGFLLTSWVNAFATAYTSPYASVVTGGYIYASQWNANQTSLESFLNNQNLDGTTNIAVGGIQTTNLANLSVTDAKIYGITTAGKVNGSAIVSLGNIPPGGGTVPTVNLGSGTASSITFLRGDQTWNNPFEYYVQISNTQTSGTNGGNTTAGSFQTYPFNTKDFDPSAIATLSGSEVSLPSGTYIVKGYVTFYGSNNGNSKSQLYNFTASAVPSSCYGSDVTVGAAATFQSDINCQMVLSTTSSIGVQYYVNGSTTNGLGLENGYATQVYGVLTFQKVA